MPVIPDAFVYMECAVERHFVVGDHVVVIGEVLEVCGRDGEPLGFLGGRFSLTSRVSCLNPSCSQQRDLVGLGVSWPPSSWQRKTSDMTPSAMFLYTPVRASGSTSPVSSSTSRRTPR